MKHSTLLLLSVFMAAPAVMFAQTAGGTLTGVVTDPSGSVIADVPVTATQVETGTKIVGTTSQTGNYTLAQLPVGKYEVTVAQTGFKTFHRENITIAAAQTLRLDVTMELGQTSESVTVSAESTLLQSDTGAVTKNINVLQIEELPVLPATIFVRDPLQLVLTLPGAVYSGLAGIADRVNGLGAQTNEYKLDGEPVQNSTASTITTRNNVSPDAIQEVAIQSSNFNAEYGSVSGTLFNMVIKSGTNQYHGTMYDYLANDKFNATDAVTHTKNAVRRNDYGFNVGGPVKIPFLYNGKDKTFFFFNWEQYRDYQTQTVFNTATVPTAAYRSGDFSGLLAASGNTNLHIGNATTGHDYRDPLGRTILAGTIFDPRTTRQVLCDPNLSQDCPAGQLVTVRDPFAGNIVPSSLIDPVSAKILSKYVPLPQGPNANLLTNNYLNPVKGYRITSTPALKIDQNLGSKARIGFTYADNKTTSPIQTLGGLAEGFPEPITGNAGTFESAPTFRVNFDYTIRPTMLFHFGVGWQEYNFCACPITTNYNAASDIGLTGATAPATSFPVMLANNSGIVSSPVLGGLKNIGNAGPTYNLERHPSSSANLTWVHGNHTFKLGADFRIDDVVFPSLANTAGSFGFGGATASAITGNGITSDPAMTGVAGFSGNTNEGFPFANWLMGSVTSLTLSTPVEYGKKKQQYGLFIQDTWRIRRNLTLDYGLRWDYGTYAKEDFGRVAAFGLTTPNPAAGGRLGGYIYEASCGCQFASNYPYAVGPRLGIAYTLDKKTVIRGGAGLAYGSTPFTGGGVINSSNSPTAVNGFDLFTLQQGIPAAFQPLGVQTSNPSAGFTVGAQNNALAGVIDPNAGRPDRTFQWNLSVQREITRNTVVEVAYVGNRNVWAPTGGFEDYNAVSPAMLQHYGFTLDGSTQGLLDEQLLNTRLNALSPTQLSTLAQRGIALPYSSFPTSSTVFQSLRNFPQFSGGLVPSAPLGKSWYDSLQATVTKRFSHGLSGTVAYTFSKNLQYTSSPDIFNPSIGKDLVGANPPQILHIAFEYQVPYYKGSMPVLRNKAVSSILGGWALSSALYYQTAGYLGRPSSGATNPISLWLGRGPGSAQLLKNPDGSYMNPWSVNWTDLAGVHHTDPIDINCHCFDPAKTEVLNPAAWAVTPDATWTADTSTYAFFRGPRHPTESMNFARNFKIKERYNLQIRMEFQNVFNRVQLPNPSLGGSFLSPTYTCSGGTAGCNISQVNGSYTGGFGTFGNSTAPAFLGTPRSGQLIARFTF